MQIALDTCLSSGEKAVHSSGVVAKLPRHGSQKTLQNSQKTRFPQFR